MQLHAPNVRCELLQTRISESITDGEKHEVRAGIYEIITDVEKHELRAGISESITDGVKHEVRAGISETITDVEKHEVRALIVLCVRVFACSCMLQTYGVNCYKPVYPRPSPKS